MGRGGVTCNGAAPRGRSASGQFGNDSTSGATAKSPTTKSAAREIFEFDIRSVCFSIRFFYKFLHPSGGYREASSSSGCAASGGPRPALIAGTMEVNIEGGEHRALFGRDWLLECIDGACA